MPDAALFLEHRLSTAEIAPVGGTIFGRLTSMGVHEVAIDGNSFLGAWQERSGRLSIPHCIDNLESSGVLHNFRRVADGEAGDFRGMWFADSDLYKTLEAIGWESARTGSSVHTQFLDSALDLIERTQASDGYLNTYVQGDATKAPWSNLVWSHELYCAGHLFQAAVALKRGIGNGRLLEVARRFANEILADLDDRDDGFDGHPEIETALVELSRELGDSRYLEFAITQLHRRGHGRLPKDPFGREYFQDHEPIEKVNEVTGHAVRQIYLATGIIDAFLQNGNEELLNSSQRLWDSAFTTKTYLTGGHGSRHSGEAFGDPYELPPDRAYAETCAGIASFQWNWRMLLATGRAQYAAAMEDVLFNTIAASVSSDGTHFFYTNPLQLRTGHRGVTETAPSSRLSWFECACCPPNLSRLIASLGSYVATKSGQGVQLQLLATGTIESKLDDGRPVTISVNTGLPWTGDVVITAQSSEPFELAIRIPAWGADVRARFRGTEVEADVDGYLRVLVGGVEAPSVELDLGLAPMTVSPHPRIDGSRGAVALRRGPFIYCIEESDHQGLTLEDIRLVESPALAEAASDAPGVHVALRAAAELVRPNGGLYEPHRENAERQQVQLTAIPYFAWGNRGDGAMRVWIPSA